MVRFFWWSWRWLIRSFVTCGVRHNFSDCDDALRRGTLTSSPQRCGPFLNAHPRMGSICLPQCLPQSVFLLAGRDKKSQKSLNPRHFCDSSRRFVRSRGKTDMARLGHATATEVGRCLSLLTGSAFLCDFQRCGHVLAHHYQADRLAMRDFRWMRDLTPAEAKAALAALDKQPPPDTVRGILEMRAMREALQAT